MILSYSLIHIQIALDARKKEAEKGPAISQPKFPISISDYANAMTKVSQTEFLTQFDYGTPTDFVSAPGTSDAIILYNTNTAFPNKFNAQTHELQTYTTQEAMENCDAMNVIYQNPNMDRGQCLAIVGNYESFHVQKWMKIQNPQSRAESPLQPVGRATNSKGSNDFVPPNESNTERHQQLMKKFLDTQERMRMELKSKLERIAIDNTIIVMTTNFGQMELLTNFVCAAKAKGFDISNVVVFVTDMQAVNVAQGLGLETFYDEEVSYQAWFIMNSIQLPMSNSFIQTQIGRAHV